MEHVMQYAYPKTEQSTTELDLQNVDKTSHQHYFDINFSCSAFEEYVMLF